MFTCRVATLNGGGPGNYLFVFNTLLLQLDDPFQRLPERDGRVVVVIEVYLMRQVGGGIEKAIEFALHL